MPTYFEKNIDNNTKNWFVFDASGQTVGRLASQIAKILSGKHKVTYTKHIDSGDFVVVVNAEKVRFSGKKWDDKTYYKHTGFVGGLKEKSASDMLINSPEEILKQAVWGMLNKNPLGKAQLSKLKVYKGAEHPHVAQAPKAFTLPAKTILSGSKKNKKVVN